jgi:hypothetical protein
VAQSAGHRPPLRAFPSVSRAAPSAYLMTEASQVLRRPHRLRRRSPEPHRPKARQRKTHHHTPPVSAGGRRSRRTQSRGGAERSADFVRCAFGVWFLVFRRLQRCGERCAGGSARHSRTRSSAARARACTQIRRVRTAGSTQPLQFCLDLLQIASQELRHICDGSDLLCGLLCTLFAGGQCFQL